jgi:hypothetical protein
MSSNHTIDFLLDFISKNPRDFTYFAVGSVPRTTKLNDFISELDQIFPTFLREYINYSDSTIRVVHYDPLFKQEHNISFLKDYFASLNSIGLDFIYDSSEYLPTWRTSDYRIEVFVIAEGFDIQNEIQVIESMVQNHLKTNTKLVFQEYYGLSNGSTSLINIHKQFYNSTIQQLKKIYQSNILFDITYGESHCTTNMAVEKPLFDNYGNFINLCILNNEEREKLIGTNVKFDSIYKKLMIKNFKDLIDSDQLKYRRSVINKESEENSASIMTNLHFKMKPIISSLKKLNVFNNDDEKNINQLFINYKEIDMYKWPTDIKNIIREKN